MSVLERLCRNPQAVIGFAMIALFLLVAAFAPLLAPNNPYEQNLLYKYGGPDSRYPLGTDQLGRCVLSRLIYGARYSLGISLPVVALLGAIGIVAGCFSACAGPPGGPPARALQNCAPVCKNNSTQMHR